MKHLFFCGPGWFRRCVSVSFPIPPPSRPASAPSAARWPASPGFRSDIVLHRSFFTALVAGALALAACDKPTGGTTPPTVTDPPETAAREVALGQAVTESLESATDVDEFALTVQARTRGLLHFEGTGIGTGQGALSIAVVDSSTGVAVVVRSSSGTASGFRFELPAGRLLVRVRSAGGIGSYTFTLHGVDPRPEGIDSVLPLRQWVHGALAPGHDVDEFVFDGVQGQEVSLYMNVEADGGLIDLVVHAPGRRDTLFAARSESRTRRAHVDPFRLPATGRYRVALTTPDPVETGFGGPYRLMLYPVVQAPERVPPLLHHAQPVGEDLDMDDDIDEYAFTAANGEMFQFFFDIAAPAYANAGMRDPATGQEVPQDGHDWHAPRGSWHRWTAPRAGEFTIRVEDGEGEYRVEMFRIDPRPEQVPANITLGETVQGESLYPSEDVDVYQLTAAAGTEIVLMAQGPLGSWLDLLPAQGDEPLLRLLVLESDDMETNTSTRFVLPAGGTYRVRMAHHETPHTGMDREPFGPYRFRVAPVRQAPESVPAAITIGQTVAGERLEHRGDIDVFTFHAQAGERLTLWGDGQPVAHTAGLVMTIQRPGQEVQPPLAYIWPSSVMWAGTFVVPETGTYEVRVFASSSTSPDPAHMLSFRGPYQLAVRRAE